MHSVEVFSWLGSTWLLFQLASAFVDRHPPVPNKTLTIGNLFKNLFGFNLASSRRMANKATQYLQVYIRDACGVESIVHQIITDWYQQHSATGCLWGQWFQGNDAATKWLSLVNIVHLDTSLTVTPSFSASVVLIAVWLEITKPKYYGIGQPQAKCSKNQIC